MKRLERERKTVESMIRIHCGSRHAPGEILCPECTRLRDYAFERLAKCRFGSSKPVCVRCTIGCYRPEMQEAIRRVMRFAGPRMAITHPLLSFRHLLDSVLFHQE